MLWMEKEDVAVVQFFVQLLVSFSSPHNALPRRHCLLCYRLTKQHREQTSLTKQENHLAWRLQKGEKEEVGQQQRYKIEHWSGTLSSSYEQHNSRFALKLGGSILNNLQFWRTLCRT